MSFSISKELHTIRNKFILLYILNITDIIFTLLLIETGMFQEVNFFMQPIIQNKPIILFLKAIVPLLLLFYVYIRMHKATQKQILQATIIIDLCLFFYLIINCSHVVWAIMYLLL